MAYNDYMDYGAGVETEEERKRREEQERLAAEQGGGFMDKVGSYVQGRVDRAIEPFTNPGAALDKRMGMTPEQSANTEVQSQTVKTYGDGSQEEITKRQIPAAPVAPEQAQAPAPQMAPQPAPQPQATPVPPTAQAPVAGAQQTTDPAELQRRTEALRSMIAQGQPGQAPAAAPQPAAAPAPVAPEVPEIGQLPTPGEPTKLAGPMVPGAVPPTTPTGAPQVGAPAAAPSLAQAGAQAQATMVSPEERQQQAIIAAHNETDPVKRRQMFAQVLGDSTTTEPNRALANKFIAEDYIKERNFKEAEQKIAEATPTELARYMKEQKKEGSYVKAILLARLGLTDLAKREQELISPELKMESMLDPETQQRFTVVRNPQGGIEQAFDASGSKVKQEDLAKLSAATGIKGQNYTGGSKVYSIPKGDPNEGHEYTSRFATSGPNAGKFENIITTGPNAGKVYTGAPGLEKRVETSAAITENKSAASKGLIDYRLQQNLKFAGPTAYTRAGASYIGKYNAENGTNLGYNREGVLVDHNNDNKQVVPAKDGTISAVQRVEGKGGAGQGTETPVALGDDLKNPPPVDNRLTPMQNKENQKRWSQERKKFDTDFSTGQQGKAIQSMNVAIDHLDSLQKAADALKNGDVPLFNQLANSYAQNTGNPAPTDFKSIQSIVGSEVAKAVQGGATALGDRQEVREVISGKGSPDQIAGTIRQLQGLMAGQVKGLRQTYTSRGFTDEDFDKKLLPRTREVLGNIEKGATGPAMSPADKARAELEKRRKAQQ